MSQVGQIRVSFCVEIESRRCLRPPMCACFTNMMDRRRALITGVTGQDGSYLSELLVEKGYEVHGLVRHSSTLSIERIAHLFEDPHQPTRLLLHPGDLTDANALHVALERIQPDEVYNLGSQSHVGLSFANPVYTADVAALGTLRLLDAIRRLDRPVRFYQASSSEMFGNAPVPQNEQTPFRPRSPYGVAKVAGYWHTVNFREAYGLFACNGILYNHESPRRGETFVTRKITRAACRIKLGLQEILLLGNLDAERDWGYAGDYVEAMWLMLQTPHADDYVVATGVRKSVRDFCETAFGHLDLDWRDFVRVDRQFIRRNDIDALQGDATKARQVLGWRPKIVFEELVARMVEADLELASQERAMAKA
jgi:GDPmannose 4,6-dehydratase